MKKRSHNHKNALLTPKNERVGGRQKALSALAGGGGYLNDYSSFKLLPRETLADPRLLDLKRMGLHHTWQKVAEAIGMDAFLTMWRILDSEEQFRHYKGNLEINLRRYSSYTRYQRNAFIRDLSQAGLSNKEIAERLNKSLCEKLGVSHIQHLLTKG